MIKLNENRERYNQVINQLKNIYNLVDVPDQLFKVQYDYFVFLDRDAALARSDKFFNALKKFLTQTQERKFYLAAMDKFIHDILFNLNEEKRDKLPFYEFDVLLDDLSAWHYALEWNKSHGFQDYVDGYWLPLIFGETDKWAIFLKKGEDFGVFGFASELEEIFRNSFQVDEVNGNDNFDELLHWLTQIVGEEYVAEMRKNYYTDYVYR